MSRKITHEPSVTPAGPLTWRYEGRFLSARLLLWRGGVLRLNWTAHSPRWSWNCGGHYEVPIGMLLRWQRGKEGVSDSQRTGKILRDRGPKG